MRVRLRADRRRYAEDLLSLTVATAEDDARGEQARLCERGGFPRSFLADTAEESLDWRRAFVRTLLERDTPQLGMSTPAETLRRSWTMTAHDHGQVWNAADLARSLGRPTSSTPGSRWSRSAPSALSQPDSPAAAALTDPGSGAWPAPATATWAARHRDGPSARHPD